MLVERNVIWVDLYVDNSELLCDSSMKQGWEK